ncbi:hypothetical protein CERZMDRAFT_102130 [Cercospora zeae-maydis SCOH1-5]|uniref:Uncharacterized protein n=1 Tax=Cercospora zeae-maydis SCOH1-5 TaxID=717836 RepID=A0A6A6F2V9_9PEZI|nr:hypothetical protein CERZMDRAFT_102130 [Cercospora zeae-maydis SCOH1-5]
MNKSPQLKDHFIEANQNYQDQMICYMAFIDDLSATYTEEAEIGEDDDDDDDDNDNEPGTRTTQAPFKDKTYQECLEMLRKLRIENESDIRCSLFVVMDERSLEDDTVVLVQAPFMGEEGEIKSVRAEFQVAYSQLMTYEMAYEGEDIEADQAAAQATEDGVLRAAAIKARRKW